MNLVLLLDEVLHDPKNSNRAEVMQM